MKTIHVRGRLLLGLIVVGVLLITGLVILWPKENTRVIQRTRAFEDENRQGDEDPQLRRYNSDRKLSPNHVPVNKGDEKNYPYIKNDVFISPQRIVHLDLKGAKPKTAYVLELIKLIAKLGGTGILFEWEDTFPYDGDLEIIRAKNAFSKDDIRLILQTTKDAGLSIIPLVQTFGHLEWILKYEQFAKFRQQPRFPQVICLSDESAVKLVESALKQVLAIHAEFDMPFFHMGADEAFQVGMCDLDVETMRTTKHNNRERLMLRHIARIGDFIRAAVPTTRVLMWHDMITMIDQATVNEYKLGEDIEPVVWNYAENLDDQLYPELWQRFGRSFDFIWGASSFKGADGPDRYYSNVPHYLLNHESWLKQQTSAFQYFRTFRGIILTGWQRFDHFARLCETLPVGTPSLAINLLMLKEGGHDATTLATAGKLLECTTPLHIDMLMAIPQCAFPGYGVYEAVQRLRLAEQYIEEQINNEYQMRGWMGRFNVAHNYSQPWYLDQIADRLTTAISMIEHVADSLRREMSLVFHADTVDEFIFEDVEPHTLRLHALLADVRRLGALESYPRRPFRVNLTSAHELERRIKQEEHDARETNSKILNADAQAHVHL